MANPTWPQLDEGKWNLIATNVTIGIIDRLKTQYAYWSTYVITGQAAPADLVKDKSRKLFIQSDQEKISSTVSIDVYIWLENSNTDTDEINIKDALQVNL